MKVWIYYYKPERSDPAYQYVRDGRIRVSEAFPIFAITNSKNLKKAFESVWNMERFIRKTAKMTKQEYAAFAHNHRGSVIEIYRMIGASNVWKKNQKIEEYEIPITMVIKQELIDHPHPGFDQGLWLGNSNYLNPYTIKDKYKAALDLIGYTSAYNYFVREYATEFYEYMGSMPTVSFNELEWFVQRWGELLLV